jgi:hypothetical protein
MVYDVVGLLPAGSSLPLVARTPNGVWLQVDAGGRLAWVIAELVQFNRTPDQIPIATDIPPRPTATTAPTATATATPTPTPPPPSPLVVRHSVREVTCISDSQYRVVFGIEVLGGTGQHFVYRDEESQVVYGPGTERSFSYELVWGAGYAAVGTFHARSGDQHAESKFYVQSPNCQP